MKVQFIQKSVFQQLKKPEAFSRKGDNGQVLVLAGSRQYHGPVFFAGIAASRIVDLVYLATAREHKNWAKKQSPEFIVTDLTKKSVAKYINRVDSILIGPGMQNSLANRRLANWILQYHKKTKTVLDATAFQLVSPKALHSNCCITPHAQEFENFFGVSASPQNALKKAKEFDCLVCLKSHYSLVTDGKKIWQNPKGNPGLTTGGTGDVLAGLITGFAAQNPLLLSSQAALYLLGATADSLYTKKRFMFNAVDLLDEVPLVFKSLTK
ncbi:NAD(P)H-hydrate dehydratase [Candidatus Micrarchaeota archaeon]|nr:NAD(P)H-hydrate dehydratase [Candidatus Micrarchaeota archaeon]MBU1930637.1 NAD(P)H-hydrate dehydratase [Candidatus Micrarchaeota archaeon]